MGKEVGKGFALVMGSVCVCEEKREMWFLGANKKARGAGEETGRKELRENNLENPHLRDTSRLFP